MRQPTRKPAQPLPPQLTPAAQQQSHRQLSLLPSQSASGPLRLPSGFKQVVHSLELRFQGSEKRANCLIRLQDLAVVGSTLPFPSPAAIAILASRQASRPKRPSAIYSSDEEGPQIEDSGIGMGSRGIESVCRSSVYTFTPEPRVSGRSSGLVSRFPMDRLITCCCSSPQATASRASTGHMVVPCTRIHTSSGGGRSVSLDGAHSLPRTHSLTRSLPFAWTQAAAAAGACGCRCGRTVFARDSRSHDLPFADKRG